MQPLGAWMVLGLVMCDGLLFLAAWSKDLKGFGIYSRAYYTRSQGLEPSRRGVRAFLEPQPWVHGVGHVAQCKSDLGWDASESGKLAFEAKRS